MKRFLVFLFALLVLVFVIGGCDKSADSPQDPVWAKEPCASCSMLVTEPRFAAQITTTDGRRLYFDDIGCMIAFVHDGRATPRKMWVHDAKDAVWHDAASAHYEAGVRTPMDFGYVAHPPAAAGSAFDEVRTKVVARIEQEKSR